MAFIVFKQRYKNKLCDVISPDKAAHIARAMQGSDSIKLSERQKEFLDNVKAVYFAEPRRQYSKEIIYKPAETNEMDRRYK